MEVTYQGQLAVTPSGTQLAAPLGNVCLELRNFGSFTYQPAGNCADFILSDPSSFFAISSR